jgi:hypothetical protein
VCVVLLFFSVSDKHHHLDSVIVFVGSLSAYVTMTGSSFVHALFVSLMHLLCVPFIRMSIHIIN